MCKKRPFSKCLRYSKKNNLYLINYIIVNLSKIFLFFYVSRGKKHIMLNNYCLTVFYIILFSRFPPEIVAVDVSGRCFDRMSIQRRSLLHPGEYRNGGSTSATAADGSVRRRTRTRRPRSKRRNTLAGTDQKEIRDALTAGFVIKLNY